ncbi:hypothetical protein [Absidia glauca]|uniref:Uncharacterized protein n=1 Tax=Absidia glauca TaxID=4829 RepID=A0A168LMN3_ABSGL|nr:hypothetical protein [Absidia glauca]
MSPLSAIFTSSPSLWCSRNAERYWPRPTEWANGMKPDVLYATDDSRDLPPVLVVEIHHTVDTNSIHRMVQYFEEIVTEYGLPPVVLVIDTHEYVALGSFFVEGKQSLADHPHHHDPIIQRFYSSARHIFQIWVMADQSMTSSLLRVVEDTELRYSNAINMLDNNVSDAGLTKRTIDYLKEGMNLIKRCKREYICSQSLPVQLSTTSSEDSREPSPVNDTSNIPESSSAQITIPPNQPSPENITSDMPVVFVI